MKHHNTKLRILYCRKGCLTVLCLLLAWGSYAQVGEVLWEENFNTLDTDIWNIDVGDGCAQNLCGWGNQELQWYGEDNVFIEPVPGEAGNNALVLEARNQASNGRGFTSGKIQSNTNLAVQYGMIEVRMRVPDLQTGLWPAAWLLGTTPISWPGKGEIDIMEMGHSQAERARQGYPGADINSYVGSNLIFAADAACSDGNPSCAASTAFDVEYNTPYVASTPLSNRFVTYRLYWTSEKIRFTITDNGQEYDLYESPFIIGEESTEFQQPFYLLFNMAVGGNFTDAAAGGQVTAPLPAKMYVDYVRVSKYNGEGEVFFGNINPPETGTLGVFTDDTPTTNKLQAGVSSDIFAWNGVVEGTTAPYEGSEVIAWEYNAPNNWFGGGIIPRQARDMSNFEDGNLKFNIKIPADVSFRIGITDNFTNESYVTFPANETKYGLVRNGEWGEVTIPISELKGELIALQSMKYLFAITSVDGAFPTRNFQLAIDDVYWEGGGGEPDPVLTSITVSPDAATLEVNDTQRFRAQAFDQNGDPIDADVRWTTTGGTIDGAGLYTATSAGEFIVTASAGEVVQTATVTVNAPDPGLLIEAETLVASAGVQTEPCSEGGENVGYIDAGDWMVWDVALPTAGSYLVEYRVASLNGGGVLQLEKAGGSPLYGEPVSVPRTGGWQVWTTVSQVVNLPAGQQQIALSVPSGGWNINWLRISRAPAGRVSTAATAKTPTASPAPESIVIYPNPVTDELTVKGLGQEATVELYDLSGQLIKRYPTSQPLERLDVRTLRPGGYFLRVFGETTRTFKFIKQ